MMHLLPWLLAVTSLSVTTPADVSTAACGYRVEVYARFHTDRDAYDLQIKKADDLIQAWKKEGQSDRDAEAITEWFRDARRAVADGRDVPVAPQLLGGDSSDLTLEEVVTREPKNSVKEVSPARTEKPVPNAFVTGSDQFRDFDGPTEQADSVPADSGDGAREPSGALDGLGRALRGLLKP